MRYWRPLAILSALGLSGIAAAPLPQSSGIDWPVVGAWFLEFGISLITFLILGVLALWLIPKPFDRWAETVRQAPFKSFGLGILALFSGYAAILILFILLLAIGIFLYAINFGNLGAIVLGLGLPGTGLIFGALNLLVAYASKLVVALLLGKIIFERLAPKAIGRNFWPLLVGLILYLLVRSIPWLGWAVGVGVTLLGLGAIWLGSLRPRRELAAPSAVQPDVAPDQVEGDETSSDSSPEAAAGADSGELAPQANMAGENEAQPSVTDVPPEEQGSEPQMG